MENETLILIRVDGRIVNEMTDLSFVSSCGDNTYFEWVDGKLEIEDIVSRWNLDQRCGNRHQWAEIVVVSE
jgi:hypothetical protein